MRKSFQAEIWRITRSQSFKNPENSTLCKEERTKNLCCERAWCAGRINKPAWLSGSELSGRVFGDDIRKMGGDWIIGDNRPQDSTGINEVESRPIEITQSSRKLTEHCKPNIMGKLKIILKRLNSRNGLLNNICEQSIKM